MATSRMTAGSLLSRRAFTARVPSATDASARDCMASTATWLVRAQKSLQVLSRSSGDCPEDNFNSSRLPAAASLVILSLD